MHGGSLKVQSAFEMHRAAMFPHHAVSGPSGVMHGSTHTGQCHLGAALSCMAFYFRPSLFLSTTSKVKYCPYILLTEPERKKYRSGQNKKRWERETRADCRAGATPTVFGASQQHQDLGLSVAGTHENQTVYKYLREKGFVCVCMQIIVLIKSFVNNTEESSVQK